MRCFSTSPSAATLAMIALVTAGCGGGGGKPATLVLEGTGHVILKPLAEPAMHVPVLRKVVYVPVYSSMYWGFDGQVVDLAATLSIRNVSLQHPIVVHFAKYFDTVGKEIRDYVPAPSSLAPMATADFVVQRKDVAGGSGANFLVEWSSAFDIDEPVIEAVMLGQQGNSGISFVSAGRALTKASAGLGDVK